MLKHFTIFSLFTFSIFALDGTSTEFVTNEVENNIVQGRLVNKQKMLEIKKDEKKIHAKLALNDDNLLVLNKKLHSPKDIKIFTNKEIEPINYTNTVSLKKLQVSEKKQKFFHMLLPAILISKENLRLKRERVIFLSQTPYDDLFEEDKEFLDGLFEKYKTTNIKKLISRLKTHPVSIILAQAAIESAWGESRFFKEGNNIFGMWSYNRHEPRIRAKGTRKGKAIYVKKYANLSEAIDDYFLVIGRGAYKSFRRHRNITDNPLQLVQYLVNYCELKEKYTRKLRKFIVYNKLRKFDKFKLEKQYM
jgi:Bax protein